MGHCRRCPREPFSPVHTPHPIRSPTAVQFFSIDREAQLSHFEHSLLVLIRCQGSRPTDGVQSTD